MNKIWKYLDIENFQAIGDQMYDFVVNQTDILKPIEPTFFTDLDIQYTLYHVPLLKKFLDNQFLMPTKLSIIVVPAKSKPYLHVDTEDAFVRILWPVKNCAGSRTKFYDIPREYLKLRNYPDGVIYYDIIEQREWEYLDEFELVSPLVFDASTAHEVHPVPNLSEHRISFSIGFDRDLPISKSVKAWFGFQR